MVEIHFEALPGVSGGSRRPRGEHAEIAAKLRERPSEWAPIGTFETARAAGSLAYAIRKGRLSAYLPEGAFEASARTVGEEHRLYVRFVGEKSDE